MQNKLEEIIRLANELKENLSNDCEEINQKLEIKEENGRRYFEYLGIRYDEFKPNEFVAKDILSKKVIDNIVEDKRYLDSDFDVRYSNDIFDNSWENSFVRKILNSTFKEKYLKDLNLDGEVRLLTKKEAENLPEGLKETSRCGYWTMSPYRWSGGNALVFLVDSGGWLNDGHVNDTRGLRPVIKLNTDEL